jgi:hypothetical protein
MLDITARPRLLSVTESIALPPPPPGGPMPDTPKFDFRGWLVPPVLLPVFFGPLIDAAVVLQWSIFNWPAAAKSARVADRRRHGKYSDHQERRRTARHIRRIKDGAG